ncbi:MAG: right-handed parallel beta-helix repeat-containing protein [Candidatus Melainabacteria bacterium]|nr:MAG: right-handed parallel beta-helix repeat-containing protein [Candidatus Melainabacteria bacterium]
MPKNFFLTKIGMASSGVIYSLQNAHESFESQQLALNTTNVSSDFDPFSDVRFARADYTSNPFTYIAPNKANQPFNFNITNPYGPQYENQYTPDLDPEDTVDAPPGPELTDQSKPTVTVRRGESIQRAIERAPDGAIISVEAGVYNEKIKFNRDNITLRGEKGAIMDFQGVDSSDGAIRIENRNNITISGFEIKNITGKYTPTAIAIDGVSNNIRILNNDIHHVDSSSNAHAISVYGRKSTPIQNIEIAGNKVHDLKLGSSEAIVVNGNVDGFKITDNQVYNSNNIGIDVIGGERVGQGSDRARNGLIARNNVYNITSADNPKYRSGSAAGIYVDGGIDIKIENNIVQNSDYGIEIASERKDFNAERITVRNNDLARNRLAGISLGGGNSSNGGITDSIIENNRLTDNRRGIWRQNNIGQIEIRDNMES